MAKKKHTRKFKPFEYENESHSKKNRSEGVYSETDKNKFYSNETIPTKKRSSLDRLSKDGLEKSQNMQKNLDKSISSEVHERNDETSNPNEKKLCKNVPSKNKQFKQNNQEDKTEVKVLVTEGNSSNKIDQGMSKLNSTENQQSEDTDIKLRNKQNDKKSKNSKIQKCNYEIEENQSIDDKRLETAKTQSTNRRTRMVHNCANYDQNRLQSKNQDKTYKNNRQNNDMAIGDGQSSTINDDESVLEEIDQDLFKLPNEYALAHCVAEDLKMGAGIAVEFKNRFGSVGKLIDQNLKVGGVGIVRRHEYNVFYLITKRNSNGKPTMITLKKALCSLRDKMKEMNLTKLGIPAIGCGLDGLDWNEVKYCINQIFAGCGIQISVCIPSKLLDHKAPYQISVSISQINLWEMETQTDIIIFIDLTQVQNKTLTDDVVDKVNVRYPFKKNLLKDVMNKKLEPGDIRKYIVNNEIIICVFYYPRANYSCIEDAFLKIRRLNKSYRYLAIQSGSIEDDDNFKHIAKIVLIIRSVMKPCELWLCGGDTKMFYDQYCKNKRYSLDYSSKYNLSKNYDESHSSYSKERNQISQSSSSWKSANRKEK